MSDLLDRLRAELEQALDFAEIPVQASGGGSPVGLSDVAKRAVMRVIWPRVRAAVERLQPAQTPPSETPRTHLAAALRKLANAWEKDRDSGHCPTGEYGCGGYWHPKGKTEHRPDCERAANIALWREAARQLLILPVKTLEEIELSRVCADCPHSMSVHFHSGCAMCACVETNQRRV
jgi:hypothetical protein